MERSDIVHNVSAIPHKDLSLGYLVRVRVGDEINHLTCEAARELAVALLESVGQLTAVCNIRFAGDDVLTKLREDRVFVF